MIGPLDDGDDSLKRDAIRVAVIAGVSALATELGILIAQEFGRVLKKSRKAKKKEKSDEQKPESNP